MDDDNDDAEDEEPEEDEGVISSSPLGGDPDWSPPSFDWPEVELKNPGDRGVSAVAR